MLVKVDAAFEAVLGIVLLICAATGALGVLIWRGRLGLRALAMGNAVSALAGLLWLLLADGWSTAGAVLVAITVAGLAGLAGAQAATLRA